MGLAYFPGAAEIVDHGQLEKLEPLSLSVAVIDPDRQRRQQLTNALKDPQIGAIQQMNSYLPPGDDGSWLAEQGIDLIFVALDSDIEKAFATIETLCAINSVTVMVYSERPEQDLLVRAMRTGAREYLRYPLDLGELESAIGRATARMRSITERNKAYGKLFVVLGAKGGVGATTVATNFAVSLGKETGKKVLLMDLHLPLGDAALDLGLQPQYSTVDALANAARLDLAFLRRLLARHSSGISVLAAPGTHSTFTPPESAVQKLMAVSRQEFDYVVADVGSGSGVVASLLFQIATKVYLVTQVGLPELRNANRLITGGLSEYASKLEVVLNRYQAGALGIDEPAIQKVLTRSADWHIPNDYAEVRKMQNSGDALVLGDTPIARVLTNLARSACNLPLEPERKKRFGLFR